MIGLTIAPLKLRPNSAI